MTAEEHTLYRKDGVLVTTSRFVVGETTFAMSSVSSVKVTRTDITPSDALPKILGSGAILWIVLVIARSPGSLGSYILPALLLGFSVYLMNKIRKTTEYKIILTTNAGEQKALVSTNEDDVLPVEKALVAAIVRRG